MADVSLVIPSRRGGAPLIQTVGAFLAEGGAGLEVIVAECARGRGETRVADHFAAVRVVRLEDGCSIPQLRAAGIAAATAPIVAMTAEACVPQAGWLEAVRRAHAAGADVVGGAIENGSTDRLIDWAVFFCEYGRFMPPLAAEPATDLPGQNVSYSRPALDHIAPLLRQGTWEPLWHWQLATLGLRLRRDASRVVVLRKRFTFAGFVTERFAYGRSFAAQRTAGTPWPQRFLLALGCTLLPIVVLTRLGRDLIAKRRHLALLALSVPYLLVFACVWAAGEAVGYTMGAGDAAAAID